MFQGADFRQGGDMHKRGYMVDGLQEIANLVAAEGRTRLPVTNLCASQDFNCMSVAQIGWNVPAIPEIHVEYKSRNPSLLLVILDCDWLNLLCNEPIKRQLLGAATRGKCWK